MSNIIDIRGRIPNKKKKSLYVDYEAGTVSGESRAQREERKRQQTRMALESIEELLSRKGSKNK